MPGPEPFFLSETKAVVDGRELENLEKRHIEVPGEVTKICYTCKFGAVPKWPKGEVCKTSIRGFESHPRLQARLFLLD